MAEQQQTITDEHTKFKLQNGSSKFKTAVMNSKIYLKIKSSHEPFGISKSRFVVDSYLP